MPENTSDEPIEPIITPEPPKQLISSSESANGVYEKIAKIIPERNVEMPGEEDGDIRNKTASERAAESPNLSDMQTFVKQLYPNLITKWLNALQMARIFPETINKLSRIFVKQLLRDNPDISLAEAIAYVETALTIAIDGEGRIDLLAVAGVSHTENLEKEKMRAGITI